MAKVNSGAVRTPYYKGQAQVFEWVVHRNTTDSRVGVVEWVLSTAVEADDPTKADYFLCHGNQTLSITGEVKGDTSLTFKRNHGDGYNAFCDPDGKLGRNHNREFWYDSDNKRSVFILAHAHHQGKFEIAYDEDGDAKFTVKGNFAWYTDDRRTFSETFHLKNIGSREVTITFDTNNPTYPGDDPTPYPVTNMPSKMKVLRGSTINLPTKVPQCRASKFVGWSRYGVFYQPGKPIKVDSNITLFARWEKHTYNWRYWVPNSYRSLIKEIKDKTYEYTRVNAWEINHTHYYDAECYTGNVIFYDTTEEKNFDIHWVDVLTGDKKRQSELVTGNKPRDWVLDLKGDAFNITYKSNNPFTGLDSNVTRSYRYNYEKYDYNVNWTVPGVKLVGFSLTRMQPLLPNQSRNILIDFSKSVKQNTDNISSTYKSKQGSFILYAVWEYTTTTYVHTNGKYRLAIPYVYTNGKWRMAMSYTYTNNKWRL